MSYDGDENTEDTENEELEPPPPPPPQVNVLDPQTPLG